MKTYNVHLDTDIGDDIDDAFCLALLLASPEIVIQSVSTVFMDVVARAHLVAEMLMTRVDQRATIAPGLRDVMASRPRDVSKRIMEYTPLRKYERQTANVLVTLDRARRECDAILTIGPMTNLAASLLAEPYNGNGRVIAMAAEFQRPGHIEWNVMVDPEAANVCFRSGIPIDFIPWSIGPAVKLQPTDIERFRAAPHMLAKVLVRYLEEFWTHTPGKTNMYDPMTVVALLRPDLFRWERGHVRVELKGDNTYGLTMFKLDDNGPHRVAMGVKSDEAREFLVQRICELK